MMQAAVETTLPSPEEIEKLTARVLGDAEFREAAPGFLDVLREALYAVTQTLLDWAAEHPTAASIVTVAAVLLLLLLAGRIVAFLIRERNWARPLRTLNPPRASASSWRTLEGVAESWEEAMVQARSALNQGRLYQCLWIAHRAFLGWLDQKNVVEFAKWKTNRDYLTECPAGDSASPALRAVSDAYDSVVYGHQPMPADHVERLLSELEKAKENATG